MYKRIVFTALFLFVGSGAFGDELTSANTEADRVHANGKTALMAAARKGNNERLRDLIEQGADVNRPNRNGGTPIMYAALSGRPEAVSLLIENHARVDAVAANGWTALMIASVKGHAEVARLLLEHGADPNRADVYSWTPLMRAVRESRLETVRLLVDNTRTDVNRRGENGVTALHLAVVEGDRDTVKLLLAGGADPRIEDNSGRTALDFARQNNNISLLRIMNAGHKE